MYAKLSHSLLFEILGDIHLDTNFPGYAISTTYSATNINTYFSRTLEASILRHFQIQGCGSFLLKNCLLFQKVLYLLP